MGLDGKTLGRWAFLAVARRTIRRRSPSYDTRAIYLARYSEEKNHAAAVRAFGRVIAEVPEATLHTCGNGSGKGAVVELVKRLGLERSVFVHDYASDVSSIYRSAGASLLTSKGEGYSLVVVESLCQGCPVIAFDVNYGPADMIRASA